MGSRNPPLLNPLVTAGKVPSQCDGLGICYCNDDHYFINMHM